MKKYLITSTYFFIACFSFGQTSINASGGSVSNGNGSISYSIGQVVYQSNSNASGSVSQGVQQAFEIATLSLEENTFNFSLSAYPNPTQAYLNLRVGNYKQEKLSFSLFDLQGKTVANGAIQAQETSLDMNQLPVSSYFLEINHDGKKVQTFKIIKN